MMANRRCPRPTPARQTTRSPSGPRWDSVSVIRRTTAASAGRPVRSTYPAIPHTIDSDAGLAVRHGDPGRFRGRFAPRDHVEEDDGSNELIEELEVRHAEEGPGHDVPEQRQLEHVRIADDPAGWTDAVTALAQSSQAEPAGRDQPHEERQARKAVFAQHVEPDAVGVECGRVAVKIGAVEIVTLDRPETATEERMVEREADGQLPRFQPTHGRVVGLVVGDRCDSLEPSLRRS